MIKRILHTFLLSLLLLLNSGCSLSSNTSSTISDNKTKITLSPQSLRIAGSGSNLPLTQKLLDEYSKKSGIQITLPASIGTVGAIKALQENQLDLGLISRELKASEEQSTIYQRSYAKIGIIFGVHRNVPNDTITTDDVLRIYQGTKNTWSNGKNIIVLSREKGDSSFSELGKLIPGFKDIVDESLAEKRWEVYYTDQESNDAIASTLYSFGITDTVSIKMQNQIKPLLFNGVEATLENINNHAYPLSKNLYFIYKEPLTKQAKDFLDFVYSEEGQAIMSNHGALPLKGG